MISFHFFLSSVNSIVVSNYALLRMLCRPDGLPLARRHMFRLSERRTNPMTFDMALLNFPHAAGSWKLVQSAHDV
jgi:hypothetical protein